MTACSLKATLPPDTSSPILEFEVGRGGRRRDHKRYATADGRSVPIRYERVVKKAAPQTSPSPSELIDARIRELGDWRGETLARLRALVKEADPEVVEEWKWRGTPVWSHDGLICTGETYKRVVKMTFAKGASLDDPAGLFNSSLEGNVRRAIDFREGEEIDERALVALVRSAVALNTSG
jgi:hypothetical protein